MKTVIVTGATSGIGYAVAKALAREGWRVLGVGRTEENARAAKAGILAANPDAAVEYFCGDLMQQRELNRIAGELGACLEEQCGGELDVLISNAGGVRSWYATTEEGYEQQFALNHLAGFLLTYRLLPYLKKAGGRVILTGSASHKHMKIHWSDVMYQKHYSCLMAYKQSKLCNMLFAGEINRRFSEDGIRAYVVDPGLVRTDIGNKQTGGIVNWFWSLRKKYGDTPDEAAKTYVYLCNQQLAPDGLYFRKCQEDKYSRRAGNREDALRLFALSERLCGIEYGGKTK